MKKNIKLMVIILLIPMVLSDDIFENVNISLPSDFVAGAEKLINVNFYNNDKSIIPYYTNITIVPSDGTPHTNLNEFEIVGCEEISRGVFICPEVAKSGFNELSYLLKTMINLCPGNYTIYTYLTLVVDERIEYQIIKETVCDGSLVCDESPIQIEEIIKEIEVEKIVEVPVYQNQTVEKIVEVEVKRIDWFWIAVFCMIVFPIGLLIDRHIVLKRLQKNEQEEVGELSNK